MILEDDSCTFQNVFPGLTNFSSPHTRSQFDEDTTVHCQIGVRRGHVIENQIDKQRDRFV